MKTIIYSIIFLSLISCHTPEWKESFSEINNQNPETRSITQHTSYFFDWEDTTQVILPGIEGATTLPWYNGASTNIPDFILQDYTKADGWELVYNFCNDPLEAQIGKSYLMFYNIFTGILRVFVYNPNNTTTASSTFWNISLNNSCALLNNMGHVTLPMDTVSNSPQAFITNITTLPTKALSRGWNCFDIEFCYDKNIPNIPLRMNISMYDIQNEKISLTGGINLNTEGVIISTTTSNPLNTPINNTAKLAGKGVKSYLDKELGNSSFKSIISNIASEGVKGIVKSGIKLVFSSFIGKLSNTTTTTQDIRLTTKGNVEIKGNLQNIYQSNILPIANLMVPGSDNHAGQNNLLPHYNEVLGVWNLETSPILLVGSSNLELSSYSINDYMAETGRYPKQNERLVWNKIPFLFDESSVKVSLNPSIKDKIEKYTVESELIYPFHGTSNDYYNSQRSYRWSGYRGNGNIYDINDTLSLFQYHHFYHYTPSRCLAFPLPICKLLDQHQPLRQSPTPPSSETELHVGYPFQVKVTVTLYPKAPYNTTPIAITRSYYPMFKSSQIE